MFILDAESIKEARITLTLIVINIFCFIGFNYVLDDEYFYLLVQKNLNIFEDLELWRLFTAMFLHADAMHIFSNMIALLLFGATVENHFSKFEYIIIYFLSGLIGNIFSLFLLPIYSISLGASGAIFGLIGAAFIMIATEDRSLIVFGLVYIAYFMYYSLAPGINLWAHLFGLLGGILFGYLFNLKVKRKHEDYY